MLREFPLLRGFKFLSDPEQPKLNLYCNIDDGERSILHERLTVQQLRLDCDGLHVLGSSRGVRDTLAVLPALPHMRDVKVLFDDSLQVSCLERLAHVFPNLDRLVLVCEPDVPGDCMNTNLFGPLEGFCRLHFLQVYLTISGSPCRG